MSFTVAFRADASIEMGAGHVMRCLTLADALRTRGAKCVFICRSHIGNLSALIEARGYEVCLLPAVDRRSHFIIGSQSTYMDWLGTSWADDAAQTLKALSLRSSSVEWLVVDHYALDVRWELAVRKSCKYLMAIDDLADRAHDCDLLLDQNLGRKLEDYAQLVPVCCSVLTGPQYALLRPEFASLRIESLERRASSQKLSRLLISMGGMDKDNATGAVLAALGDVSLPAECRITVVMGSQAPWLESVSCQVDALPWQAELLIDVQDMASLMTQSDLAIGAAGSTSWERCCLGVPTVLVVLADNQRSGAQALQNAGCVVLLGEILDIPLRLKECIQTASDFMSEYVHRASLVTEGDGVEQVAKRMQACHAC